MEVLPNPSPGFRDHPEHTITVKPFRGVVVVTFAEAIIASTDMRCCSRRRTIRRSSTSRSTTSISTS